MSQDLKAVVQEKYGEAARRAAVGQKGSCCGTSDSSGPDITDPITRDLYDAITASTVPEAAILASLGCGNPTALADLSEGEVVLDLGSGGGIDVLSRRSEVAPNGKDVRPEHDRSTCCAGPARNACRGPGPSMW